MKINNFLERLLIVIVVVVAVGAGWYKFSVVPVYPVHKEGVVVLTGASTGIGEHAAFELDKLGYHVFAGVRKESDGEKLKAKASPKLHPIILDVTKPEHIKNALKSVTEFLDNNKNLPFAGVVNNAGIAINGGLEFNDMQEVRKLFDVNVIGLIEVTQVFLPLLRQFKGRIINVGSVAGFAGLSQMSVYCGSKHAVEGISDGLRRELRRHEVAVSVLQPGGVQTPILDKFTFSEKRSQEELDLYPMKKFEEGMSQQAFASPAVTSEAIVDALTNPSPLTRYVLAAMGPVPSWVVKRQLWLLPDYLADSLFSGFDG